MPEQIFKATYSGVPVYEMMCKGVAVMRRRADSWLNATQILKVAGFDKPQRTRVLEREVQKGEHEKVQGGYGKYQGTWVPLDRGLAISRQYNVENILRPIIDFIPAAQSPPLAPKHLAAAPATRPKRKEPDSAPVVVATRSSGRRARSPAQSSASSRGGSGDGSMTSSPSEASSSSRTPSPIRSTPAGSGDESEANMMDTRPSPTPVSTSKKRKRGGGGDTYDQVNEELPPPQPTPEHEGTSGPEHYADLILEYFISDTSQIPSLLISPPPDFDPNIAIDNDGHTALHWAAAMGRVRIMKLLLSAGADIFKVNKAGQTALMRSVMFANNYDVRKFPELYELLHRSTLNIDNFNRTVFHHIVDVAMSKGKTHAARYYMETLLTRLSEYPKELADIINFQDEDGETALTMAARCRSKRLVKILIDHGADPKISNKDGKNTEDYILEDERFRASPTIASRTFAMSFRNQVAAAGPSFHGYAPNSNSPLHTSLVAQRAGTTSINDMAALLDNLAQSFDAELSEKERDLRQAHALLANIQTEVLESKRAVAALQTQASGLDDAKKALSRMEDELRMHMGKRYRLGWEKWVKDEEDREKKVWGGTVPLNEMMSKGEAALKGKRLLEDVTDIAMLHSNTPQEPQVLHEECETLREEVMQYRKRRKVLFEQYVKSQAEAGTGGRMGEYRRLIGAGCGGVPPAEVDNVVGMLLETLEAEESNPSFVWGNNNRSTLPPVAL